MFGKKLGCATFKVQTLTITHANIYVCVWWGIYAIVDYDRR